MIGLISFGLKIIFASIIGGALNYIPGKSKRNHNIVETSLICIFSSSILGLTRQFSDNGEYFVMGFGVLSVIIFLPTCRTCLRLFLILSDLYKKSPL